MTYMLFDYKLQIANYEHIAVTATCNYAFIIKRVRREDKQRHR